MNYKDSRTFLPHKLLVRLPDEINLKIRDKYVALSNINTDYTWKNIKKIVQKQ